MTKISDEKILEFIHAKHVWVWNDDAIEVIKGRPSKFLIGEDEPYKIKDWAATFKHFSLTKPQVYEDGKWYAVVDRFGKKFCAIYSKKRDLFYSGGVTYYAHELNIRPVPEELWEDQ